MSEYRDVPPSEKAAVSADYVVRLADVTKRFGSKVAVDRVSMRVARGAVFGLIGPNGAGKTTTFSMLAGFLRPTDGTIEVLGHNPHEVDALRSRIGVLPQDAVLPPGDRVGDLLVHLGCMQGMTRERAREQSRVVLAEVEGADWWSTKCGALSHGMAKRVQFAQAMLGDPDVVLLDEPTAGLDPRVAFEIRQLIVARKRRTTLIVSSHNLHELEEMCDAAAILDHGRIVANGTISELTSSGGEIHIDLAEGPVPLDAVRAIVVADRVEFDEQRRDLAVYFSRDKADAEGVIGAVLTVLLQNGARISGVTKGRGLEQRVMELTA
jgi:ABC-2 type transport system ATP-binding protein